MVQQRVPAPERAEPTGATAAVAPAPAAAGVPNSALVRLLTAVSEPWAAPLLREVSAPGSDLARELGFADLVRLVTDMREEGTEDVPRPGAEPDARPHAGAQPPPGPAPQEFGDSPPPAQPEAAAPGPPPASAPAPAPDPSAPTPRTPDQDPAFRAVRDQAAAAASAERASVPVLDAARSAQAAAPGPSDEVAGKAAARTTQRLQDAPTPGFDKAAFAAKLRVKMEEAAPQNPRDARDFPENNQMSAAKEAMLDEARGAADDAQGGVRDEAAAPPDRTGISAKPVAPLVRPHAGGPPATPRAADAVPKPRSDPEVAAPFEQANAELDDLMARNELTEQQLLDSNEPGFVGALRQTRDAQARGRAAVPAFRAAEAAALTSAGAEATTLTEVTLATMHEQRAGTFAGVAGEQDRTMSADQQRRSAVATEIQTIFERTSGQVETRLAAMDEEIAKVFDKGAEAARDEFERSVEKKLDDRYGVYADKWRWAKDKMFDPRVWQHPWHGSSRRPARATYGAWRVSSPRSSTSSSAA